MLLQLWRGLDLWLITRNDGLKINPERQFFSIKAMRMNEVVDF